MLIPYGKKMLSAQTMYFKNLTKTGNSLQSNMKGGFQHNNAVLKALAAGEKTIVKSSGFGNNAGANALAAEYEKEFAALGKTAADTMTKTRSLKKRLDNMLIWGR